MTVEQCFAFCGTSSFAGLEYGRECWCSNVLNTYAEKLTDANCSLTCRGDKTEVCGGVLKWVFAMSMLALRGSFLKADTGSQLTDAKQMAAHVADARLLSAEFPL